MMEAAKIPLGMKFLRVMEIEDKEMHICYSQIHSFLAVSYEPFVFCSKVDK
jgi:hypothetical protein